MIIFLFPSCYKPQSRWTEMNSHGKTSNPMKRQMVRPVNGFGKSSAVPSHLRACMLGHPAVSDSETPRSGAHQAPLSMGFPRQGSWGGLPFPSPEDLPDLGIQLAIKELSHIKRYTCHVLMRLCSSMFQCFQALFFCSVKGQGSRNADW